MRKYVLVSLVFAVALFTFLNGLSSTALAAAPQPPSDFNIIATSSCAVDLDWVQSPTANVNYQIEYTTSTPDFSNNVLPVGNTSGLTFEHINLPLNSGWNYSYEIQAVDNGNPSNVSSWTASIPVTINTPSLSVPSDASGLKATGVGDGQQVRLEWSSPSLSPYGAFEIYRSTDNVTFVKIDTSSSSFGNIYTSLSNLSSSTIYYFKVRSFDTSFGCTPAEKLYSATTTAVTLPASPSGLSAVYQSLPLPGQVNLSWTGRGGQSYYKIWRATSTNPLAFFTTAGSPSMNDTSLESNQKYSYQVQSCSSNGGCSDFSNVATVTISDVPQDLTAQIYYTNGTTGSILVSWDNTFPSPPSFSNYLIERSTDGGAFSQIGSVAFKNQSVSRIEYQDVDLPLAHNYSYRVRAAFSVNYSTTASVNLNLAISLRGTAWAMIATSSGVGWVNFNSDYEVPARSGDPHYSIQADRDGLMSGSAWAAIDGNEDYGWLSFNKSDLTGCPVAGACNVQAEISSSTGVMSGWARFLRPASYSGSWDGWVSLGHNGSSDTMSSSSLNASGNLIGTAWGGDIVGWLAFTRPECAGKCTVSAAVLNQPPRVTDVIIEREPDAWCAETPFYRITWTYADDPENDVQQAADIKILRTVNGSTIAASTVISSDPFTRINDPLTVIGTNTDFYVQVRATDGIGGYSGWATSVNSTTTPNNYYPLVSFSRPTTSTVRVGSVVTFTDTSISRSVAPIQSRLWEFANASPNSTTTSPAKVIVQTVPLGVSLTETDSLGNSCIGSTSIESSGSAAGVKRRIFRER